MVDTGSRGVHQPDNTKQMRKTPLKSMVAYNVIIIIIIIINHYYKYEIRPGFMLGCAAAIHLGPRSPALSRA